MHAQRIIIVIAAAAGMLATFLPWVTSPLGSIAGTAGPDGLLNLGAFAICLIAVLLGDRRQPLHFGLLCASLIPCLLALAAGISKLAAFHARAANSDLIATGPGIYLIALAGTVALVSGCILAPQRRAVGGSLLWFSIAGLVAGMLTYSWWSYKAHGGVGLLGFKNCTDAGCETKMFVDIFLNGSEAEKKNFLADSSIGWYIASFLTAALSCLAVLANILDGIGAATGRQPAWRSQMSIAFCGGALVAAIAFTVMAPDKVTGMGAMGASVALTLAGAMFGVLGGVIFGRSGDKPSDEIEFLDVDEIVEAPICPTCRKRTQWLETQKSHVCLRCKQRVG